MGRLAVKVSLIRTLSPQHFTWSNLPPLIKDSTTGAPKLLTPKNEHLLCSVTHKGELACGAVVSCEYGVVGVGVDVETISGGNQRLGLRIMTERERERGGRVKMIWCVKEAAYKCISEAVGRKVGWKEVEVIWDDEGGGYDGGDKEEEKEEGGRVGFVWGEDVKDKLEGFETEGWWGKTGEGECYWAVVVRRKVETTG